MCLLSIFSLPSSYNLRVGNAGDDLEGIEPSKSFRNAEDSVPYGTLKEIDKLKFIGG